MTDRTIRVVEVRYAPSPEGPWSEWRNCGLATENESKLYADAPVFVRGGGADQHQVSSYVPASELERHKAASELDQAIVEAAERWASSRFDEYADAALRELRAAVAAKREALKEKT